MSQETAVTKKMNDYDDESSAVISRKRIVDHVLEEATNGAEDDCQSSQKSLQEQQGRGACSKKGAAQPSKEAAGSSIRSSKKDIMHSPGAFAEEGPSFSPSDSVVVRSQEDSSSSSSYSVEVSMLPIAASVVEQEEDETTKAAVAAQLKELESLRRQVASMTTELQTFKQLQHGDEIVLAEPVAVGTKSSQVQDEDLEGEDKQSSRGGEEKPVLPKTDKKEKKKFTFVKDQMKRIVQVFTPNKSSSSTSRKGTRSYRYGKQKRTKQALNVVEGTEASSSCYNTCEKHHQMAVSSSVNSTDIHSIDWFRSQLGGNGYDIDTASADDQLLDRLCCFDDLTSDVDDGYMTQ